MQFAVAQGIELNAWIINIHAPGTCITSVIFNQIGILQTGKMESFSCIIA